jgi:serine phosphatase RsbU (regulator of sigma subunit)
MHRVQTVLKHDQRPGDNLHALLESAQNVWKGRAPEDDVTVLLIRIEAAATSESNFPASA